MSKDVFLSVGGSANEEQEKFIQAVERRLKAEGLVPNTVGRNTFSVDTPLKTIEDLMDRCVGTVVLALERSFFAEGTEKRGGKDERHLTSVALPTPWNHIEAAMSYSRRLPLLVIVQEGLKNEGLLEPGNDWYVQSVPLDEAYLSSDQFNGILASWKTKIAERTTSEPARRKTANPSEMTVGQIVGGLKPSHLWASLVAICAALAASFSLGIKLTPAFSVTPPVQQEDASSTEASEDASRSTPISFTAVLRTRDNDHAESAGTDGNIEITFYSSGGDGKLVFSGRGAALEQGSVVREVLRMPSSSPIDHVSLRLIDNGTDKVGWLGQSLALISNNQIQYCWTWRDIPEHYLAPSSSQGMQTGLLSPETEPDNCS